MITVEARLDTYISRCSELPTLPVVALKAMDVANDINASARDLQEVIERDPSLAVRVLKVANSSMYSFQRQVESLHMGIALLGSRTVSGLVLAASLKDVFTEFGPAERAMWEHSIMAGSLAARLADYGPIKLDRQAAFTAGLLHDLGKIAFTNTAKTAYRAVVARAAAEGISFIEAERDQFGFDHAVIGAAVAERWYLPPGLVAAIRHHHDLPRDYAHLGPDDQAMVALVTVASRTCTRMGAGRPGPVEAVDLVGHPAWRLLGLDARDEERIVALATAELEAAETLFG